MPNDEITDRDGTDRSPPTSESSDDMQETIRVLAPHLRACRYQAGQVLWTAGEVSGRLVLLDRGRVKAVRVLPDGSSLLLYVFAAGELFGVLPFVDGGPYPATTIAVDDVEARVMSRSSLRLAIRKDPHVAMVLLDCLGKRLRQAFERLGDQAQRSSIARVAAALSLLLPQSARSATTTIDVPTPIQDFAGDLGMTPETFSRAVTQMVELGVLHRLASPRLQVLDVQGLHRIASGRDCWKAEFPKTKAD